MSEPASTPVTEPAAPATPVAPVAEPTATPTAPVTEPTAPVGWRDGFQADIRDNPSIQKYENSEELAKAYLESQNLIGKKGIIPPGEDATPDQMNAFYNALGRPETVDGYGLAEFEPPEILQSSWDSDGVNAVAAEMHARGASAEVVNAAVAKMAEVQAANLQTQVQGVVEARDSAVSDLRKEWGVAYDSKMDLAKRAFRSAFGEQFEELSGLQLVAGGQLGDHPEIVRVFARLGQQQAEHGMLGDKQPGQFTQTPAEAEQAINTLMNDQEFMSAMLNANDPEHGAAMKKWNDLHEMSTPPDEVL